MNNNDWYEAGQKIGDLVNDAVDNHNFKQLNESISAAINDVLDTLQRSVADQARMQRQAMEDMAAHRSYRMEGNLFRQRTEQVYGRVRKRKDRAIKGRVQQIIGYVLGINTGFWAAMVGIAGITELGFSYILVGVILGALAAALIRWGNKGRRYKTLEKRAMQYMDVIKDRDSVSIKELAAATGKTQREVREDLKAMIQESVFTGNVYLDPQATTFMTSREAYQLYEQTMEAYRQRQAEAKALQKEALKAQQSRAAKAPTKDEQAAVRRKAEQSMDTQSEETKGILKEGNAFITHIHEANIVIKGEEMSDKLDRLEHVVTRIFEQVASNPDSAPDLHKLMSYYLPITRKLVDAYIELDKQKVNGENITKTREEIENSLDTVNSAFEVFLDSFFEDTAWDISADIATLQTMMARDGLTESAFKQPGDHIRSAASDVRTGGSAGAAAYMEEEQ